MSEPATVCRKATNPMLCGTLRLLSGAILAACFALPASAAETSSPLPQASDRAASATLASSPTTSATAAKADGATSAAQSSMLKKLVGRWERPDGGYVLEIKNIDGSGKVEAGYFNPNPINVGSARATAAQSTVELFVELRDVNYPGSTYKLKYDPASDTLVGTYYQAVARETYDIFFNRMK